jgi:hypothetical protein
MDRLIPILTHLSSHWTVPLMFTLSCRQAAIVQLCNRRCHYDLQLTIAYVVVNGD